MTSSEFIFATYIVFACCGLWGSLHKVSIWSGLMSVIGRFYKTSRQPFAVLPLPVMANIIGLNYYGIDF
jgi:hypothetical protein